MRKILSLLILVVGLIGGVILASNQPKAEATVNECNQIFEYTKPNDFDDSRVHINFQNSSTEIDVSAKPGYIVTEVSLSIPNDGQPGFYVYATGPVEDFNPPGTTIDVAKVKVKGVCPTPTDTPTPTPTVEPDPCELLDVVCCEKEEDPSCQEVTPTPPQEERCTENCGNPPTFAGSTTEAPAADTCTIPFDAPNLVSYSRESDGGRTINWWPSEDGSVEKQAIVYGYSEDNLFMGVDNLPKDSKSFTIHGTDLSKVLWVQVWAYKGDCAEKSNIMDP